MSETSPIYDVELIKSLPLSYGDNQGMLQAMPSRADLQGIRDYKQGQRVVGGYEILLNTWRMQGEENARLKAELAESKRRERALQRDRDRLLNAGRDALTLAGKRGELAWRRREALQQVMDDEVDGTWSADLVARIDKALADCPSTVGDAEEKQ